MPRLTFVLALLIATDIYAARRAVLIGINEYRDWPSLSGAVNDVRILEEMLVTRYRFERRDVVTLTDRTATREAILRALRELERQSGRGDVVLFYYAGHGSQVRNSRSSESDGFDETLLAADSQRIRDKELRASFNRILDRGARLTVILDNCHSGSGARGATGVRGVAPDLRDIADPAEGPKPEDRGAIVISATQDDDLAWETRDEEGRMHGAFSWAWIRSLRAAKPAEPVIETFLRAQALLRGEQPYQQPVLAGSAAMRQTPFLGEGRGPSRDVVAVEKVRRDGTVVLQGGHADGLAVGSEVGGLRVTAIHGLTRSEAEGVAQPGELLPVRERADWRSIASPEPSPFHLDVRREGLSVDRLIGGETYEVFIDGTASAKRFVYLFVIDSRGESTLLFPRHGSVENRFDRTPATALAKIRASPPYGNDTWILLTSDEPLADPWILDRRSPPPPREGWSIERRVIPSAAARR